MWNLIRASARFCNRFCTRKTLAIHTDRWMWSWRTVPYKEIWESWLMASWICASSVLWQSQRTNNTMECIRPSAATRRGEELSCSGLHSVATPQTQCEALGATVYERHKAVIERPKEGYKDGERPREQGVWGMAEVQVPRFVQPSAELLRGGFVATSLHREWRGSAELYFLWLWQDKREQHGDVAGEDQVGCQGKVLHQRVVDVEQVPRAVAVAPRCQSSWSVWMLSDIRMVWILSDAPWSEGLGSTILVGLFPWNIQWLNWRWCPGALGVFGWKDPELGGSSEAQCLSAVLWKKRMGTSWKAMSCLQQPGQSYVDQALLSNTCGEWKSLTEIAALVSLCPPNVPSFNAQWQVQQLAGIAKQALEAL